VSPCRRQSLYPGGHLSQSRIHHHPSLHSIFAATQTRPWLLSLPQSLSVSDTVEHFQILPLVKMCAKLEMCSATLKVHGQSGSCDRQDQAETKTKREIQLIFAAPATHPSPQKRRDVLSLLPSLPQIVSVPGPVYLFRPPPLVKMRLRWGWRCSTTLKVGKQAKRWDDSCGRDFPAKVKLRVQRGLLRADKGSIARAAELRNILLPGCKVERSSTGWMPAWIALLAVYRAPSCRRCLASSARSVLTLRARSLPGGNRVAVRLRGSSSYVSRSRASPPRSGSLAAEGTHLQSVTACRDHCGSQRTTP
jgi:hypothetical protein